MSAAIQRMVTHPIFVVQYVKKKKTLESNN